MRGKLYDVSLKSKEYSTRDEGKPICQKAARFFGERFYCVIRLATIL